MSSVGTMVREGAEWLDQVRPGWQDSVDTDRLDIGSGEWCVIGQVFADEGACCGWCYVDEDRRLVEEVGEDLPGWDRVRSSFIGGDRASDRELTEAWRTFLSQG